MEGQRLELALCAVADQCHAPGVRTGQRAGGHQRGGARAQGGRHGQLGKQYRVAGLDVGQHAEGHDGVEPALGVLRVAVDVLEGIALGVGDRHQLDDADVGVIGNAGRFIEGLPPHEILLDGVGQLADEACDTDLLHQLRHRGDVDEASHGGTSS
ncbi:hypothetical protein D9M68_844010 [compost metagenome]